MSISIRRADSSELDSVLRLLADSELTTEGFLEDVSLVLVVARGDEITACAGVEIDGPDGLLRSVAVTSGERGTGVGTQLVRRTEMEARNIGIRRLYLLTTTAEGFFRKLGYQVIDRDSVPDVVRGSAEFSTCSSAGAVAMSTNL